MGLEGIVAKRRDRPYRSGRAPDWIKVKTLNAPAATRVQGKSAMASVPTETNKPDHSSLSARNRLRRAIIMWRVSPSASRR